MMIKLQKLHKGDKVAILSPSFAGPGKWPHVYKLGLKRLREVFGLEPVEFPTTKKIGATKEERAKDLINAFENKEIKAVITTLGGDDQITYIKNLPKEPFVKNPKPFFGYSDNTHFANFLWLCGVPSYYGGSLLDEFAEQVNINDFTLKYLKIALFEEEEVEILASTEYSDIDLNWDDPANLNKPRVYESNSGWVWDGSKNADGITWGGCLESIDELLRHGVPMPTLADFDEIVLLVETSDEVPPAAYVRRVYRALGERGILEKVKAVLVGRPKAWAFDMPNDAKQKKEYRKQQQEMTQKVIREYNPMIPIVQNLDFGHTIPQIPMPNGSKVRVDIQRKKIFATF